MLRYQHKAELSHDVEIPCIPQVQQQRMTELTLELQETNHKLEECRSQKDAADQRITEMAQELENSAGPVTSAQVYHVSNCCAYKVMSLLQLCSRCTTQSCCRKKMRLQDSRLLFKVSPPTNEMHFGKLSALWSEASYYAVATR